MAAKKLSAKDIIWQTIAVSKKQTFVISSDQARTVYSLWELDSAGKHSFVSSAPSPLALYKEVNW